MHTNTFARIRMYRLAVLQCEEGPPVRIDPGCLPRILMGCRERPIWGDRRSVCIVASAMPDRSAEVLDTIPRLQKRIKAARAKSMAVCADAAVTLDAVHRARAARRGEPYQPELQPTFVSERRSRFSH